MKLNNQINKTYLEATKNWKSLIDLKETKKITSLLNNGTFKITREEYDSLDKSSERVHYYFGIINTELYVFIIDSNNDAKKDHSKVIIKQFSYGIDTSSLVKVNITDEELEVSTKEYLKRLHNWNLFSFNWIEDQLNSNIFFEAISSPFKDLSRIFEKSKVSNIYPFFGLHHEDNLLGVSLDKDFSKYKLDFYCSYICSENLGKDLNLDIIWPVYSDNKKNINQDTIYSLFND